MIKHNFRLLLDPKLVIVNDQIGKSLSKCIFLYWLEEVLRISIWIVCFLITPFTQCVDQNYQDTSLKTYLRSNRVLSGKTLQPKIFVNRFHLT